MCKKFSTTILSIIAILTISQQAQAYKVKTFQPLKIAPLAVPYNQYASPEINENYPKITQIEQKLFNKTYEKESIYNRLHRLEKKLFKKDFGNLPLANRVDNIVSNIDASIMYNISTKELEKLERKVNALRKS